MLLKNATAWPNRLNANFDAWWCSKCSPVAAVSSTRGMTAARTFFEGLTGSYVMSRSCSATSTTAWPRSSLPRTSRRSGRNSMVGVRSDGEPVSALSREARAVTGHGRDPRLPFQRRVQLPLGGRVDGLADEAPPHDCARRLNISRFDCHQLLSRRLIDVEQVNDATPGCSGKSCPRCGMARTATWFSSRNPCSRPSLADLADW